MRANRKRKDRIINLIIITLILSIISISYKMIDGYEYSGIDTTTEHIQVSKVSEYRSYMLKLTSPKGDVYYTHTINKAYIDKRIMEEDEPKFRVKVIKNNWFVTLMKIRPKYEIVNLGVDY